MGRLHVKATPRKIVPEIQDIDHGALGFAQGIGRQECVGRKKQEDDLHDSS